MSMGSIEGEKIADGGGADDTREGDSAMENA